jgi:ferric-dicitrate binding protein FerR (iron transport regulator)
MILPDSTFICLNSGSKLKYNVNGEKGKRVVYLDGEAWFQVQKSADRPFIVHTGFYDVQVTGTEFNVKAYAEDSEVVTTLEKGSVVINSGNIRLKEPAPMKPGEQLAYNKESRKIFMKAVNTQWFTSWKDNKLIFVNMNLKELMVLLERKYGVDIRIEDPKILNYHYDGTFKNETILEVLNLLAETLPIRYSINNQIIEIKRK